MVEEEDAVAGDATAVVVEEEGTMVLPMSMTVHKMEVMVTMNTVDMMTVVVTMVLTRAAVVVTMVPREAVVGTMVLRGDVVDTMVLKVVVVVTMVLRGVVVVTMVLHVGVDVDVEGEVVEEEEEEVVVVVDSTTDQMDHQPRQLFESEVSVTQT